MFYDFKIDIPLQNNFDKGIIPLENSILSKILCKYCTDKDEYLILYCNGREITYQKND